MAIGVISNQTVGAKDVMLVGYTASTYQNMVTAVAQLTVTSGAAVVWFGPRPPAGPPTGNGVYWVDSQTAWTDDDNFTLMGNVLSLWSFTGELAGATARQNKTLVFRQSDQFPGGTARNSTYPNQLFHVGIPKMSAAVTAGTLSTSYLDAIATLIGQIAPSELSKIVATGQTMAQKATAGNPPLLIVDSRLATYLAKVGSPYFSYLADASTLASALPARKYLVYLGSYALDLESYRTVRNTPGANAAWIVAPLAHQTDPTTFGDTLINQHWDVDDAVVTVPGYDIPILPPSGFVQLFVYDLLLRATGGTAPTVSITVPAAGTSVSGAAVTVTASATAGSGATLTSVQFKVDGVGKGAAVTASPYTITLDTTTVTNGAHTLTAVATDSGGTSTTSAGVSVTVANPPAVSITAPAAGATVSGAAVTMTASATAATGATVVSVQFKVDGVSKGAAVTVSPYTIALDTTALSNGTHTLTAVATDSGGTSTTSAGVSVTVANSTTAVSITSPAAGASISGSSVTLTATAQPGSGLTITNVQFKVDGVSKGALVATSPYTTVLDTTTLANGSHTITAVATDSGGNSTPSAGVTVTVATLAITPPTAFISGFTPSSPRNNYTGWVGMQFQVGGTPLNVVSLGRVYVSGNTGTHIVKLVHAGDGTDVAGGSVNITLPAGTAGQLTYSQLPSPVTLAANTAYYLVSQETLGADQWYDIGSITTTNVASVKGPVYWNGFTWVPVNFVNAAYVPVSLQYSTASPTTVSITAPAAGTTVSGNNVALSASATAGGGLSIASLQFKVDGVNQGTALSTSPYSGVLDTTKLSNGSHTLTAVVIDSASNTATSPPVTVTVSNPPTVTITAPASGASVSGASVNVTVTANSALGTTISSVQFKIDSVNKGAAVAASPYSIVLDTTTLTNGAHTLTAVVTDSTSGTATSAAVNITVNNPPIVSITAPAAGTSVSGSSVTVSANATPALGATISSVQFKVDNVNTGASDTSSPYSTVVDTLALSNGTHTLTAVAIDATGNSATSAAITITVGNNTSTVAITAPTAAASVTGPAVTLTASASPGPGLTVTNVQFKVDGVNKGAAVTASPYSLVLDTTALNNGSHTLIAVVTDSAGSSTASAPVSVTVNNPPSVSITAPAAGAIVSGASVAVSASAAAAPGTTLSSVQFKVDNVNAGAADTTSPYGITLDTTALTSGAHTLTAVAIDSTGNATTSAAVSVTVSNNTTAVAISAPAAGASLSGATVSVTATTTPGTGVTIATVQFRVDGVNTGAAITASPYSIVLDSTALTNGSHILTAVVTDSSSNSATSAPITVTVSNPPTVSVTAPAAGASVSGASVPVSATATAALGTTVSNVQFKVDTVNAGAPDTTSPYGISLDSTTLANGAHSLTAVATDSTGNSTTSAAVSITVNNSVTAIAITAPATGASVSGASVSLTATATPGTSLTITSVQFKIDGVNSGAPDTTNPYSITFDSTPLSNGSHIVTAVATDSSGGTTTSTSVNITVNNAVTAVSISSPAAGANISGASVPVTATATPGGALTIANIQFKVDGVNKGAAVTTAPYSINLDTTSLTDGAHSLTAVATDSAGATTTSAPVAVSVNNTPAPSLITGFTPTSLRNNFTGGVGFQFKVGTSPLTVVSLGRISVPGNTGSHTVKLVRTSDGTDVAGGTVTVSLPAGTAGQFTYVALPAALTLPANTSYYLVSQETLGGDQWYDISFVTGASVVSIPGPVYWNGFSYVPVSLVNASFVPVSLQYSTAAPPSVSITAPGAGASVSGNAVAVSASATPGTGLTITSVQFKVDGSNQGAPVTTAPYNLTLDATKMVNGTHSVIAMATDSAGISSTSAAVSFTVNNQLPTVTITSPAGGSAVSGSSVTVAASPTAGTGLTVASVQLKVDNAAQGTAVTAAPYDFTLDSTALSNGTHVITAVVTDSAGNLATSSTVTVTVSNTPSAVSITAPTAGATVSGSSVGLVATATPASGLTITSVQFKLDGVNKGAADTTSPYGLGLDTTTIVNGSHTLTAVATDSASHVVTSSAVSITVNNPPPVVTVNAPAAGATLSGSGVTLTATATAGAGMTLASVQFKADGVNIGGLLTVTPYTTTFDSRALTNGTHAITATATDAAGNTTTSSSVSVTAANVTAAVSITAPAGGANVSGNAVTISAVATASAGQTITGVQFRVDGANQGGADTTSPYGIVWDTTKAVNGNHTLTAVATDSAAAIITSPNISVIVNNPAPTVAVTSPVSGSVLSGTVSLTASASAGAGLTLSTVQFNIDNVIQGAPLNVAPFTTSVNTATLASGTHSITAVVTDSAGSSTTSSAVIVSVSNGPVGTPIVSSFTPSATRNNYSGNVGMEFTVGATPLSVVALGRIYVPGNSASHSVRLVKASDNSDVAGGSVIITFPSGTPGQFTYAQLGSPVALAANTSYFLVSQETAGGDSWYDVSSVTPSSTVSVVGPAFYNGASLAAITNANNAYVPVNLIYSAGATQPSVGITTPPPGSSVSGSAVTVAASATASTGLSISNVQFTVDGVNQGSPDTTSPYSIVVDATKLVNGSHTLSAVATDSAGVVSTSAPVAITVGNGSPTVSITTPAPGATIAGSSVALSATATAATGLTVARVQFKVDNVNVGAAGTTSPYAITLDATTLGSGTHSITAVVTDSAGNTATSAAVNVGVIGATTTVLIGTPSAGGPVSGSTVAVSATVTPGAGLTIANVQFKVDGVSFGPAVIASPYTSELNTLTLVNGIHNLTAAASDSSSTVVTSAPLSVIVANPAPTVSITAPTAGSNISGSAVTVSANAVAGAGMTVASVQFKVDGLSQGAPDTTSPYSISLSASTLANGSHTITAVATDSAGNSTTSSSVAVTVSGGTTTPTTALITGFNPGSARNNFSGWVGMKFGVGPISLSVGSLGRIYVPGNTGSHVVKLVRADSVDVPGGAVTVSMASGSVGQFTYGQLAAPITLSANTSYFLVSAEAAGADQWYDIGQVGTTSVATVTNPVYFDGAQYSPAASGSASYVPVNLQYAITSASLYTPPAGVPFVSGHNLQVLRNNFSGWAGMKFTVGCGPLTVAALGRIYIAGNTGTHAVKLVRASDGGDVPGASTSVSLPKGIPGQFIYGQLATAVTLQANTAYYLVSQEVSGGDQFYDYEGVAVLSAVAVNGGVSSNGPTSWSTVSSVATTFVGVDMLMAIQSAPPLPSAPAPSPGPPSIAKTQPAALNHFLITGQSLATAINGGPALSVTQPYNNLMLSPDYKALIPLVEGNQVESGYVETIASGMGNTLTALSTGQSYVDIVTNNGRAGYDYTLLSKGMPAYIDGLNQLTAARNLAQAQGKSFKIGGIVVMHGETDQAGSPPPSYYEADLVQWQQDYQTDSKAISGQTDSVPFFIDQISSWGHMTSAFPTVPLAQLGAAEDHPGLFYMVGPKYQYRYADGLHLEKFSYRKHGEQFGKVMKKVLLDGVQWRPLSPYTLNRTGSVITAQFYVPAPPMQFDTNSVLAKPNMGFEYSDGTACSPYITSVQIISPDTVALTLSGLPTGASERLRYAYTAVPYANSGNDQPGSGRGNVKDSDATPSLFGNELSNWLVTFDKPITAH